MRTVVTGVDDAQGSRAVLSRALAEAESTGRPLEALHAWSTPTWASGAVGLDDTEGVQTGREQAQELAAHLLGKALEGRTGSSRLRATARGGYGDAGDLLVRAGADAGLLVVGARSHGAVLSAVLGSATSYALHRAACPVMVVPRADPLRPYRRVVVGYDDQERAGSALRWALDAARRHRCPLLVLHALRRTPFPVRMSSQVRDASREDEVHTWLAAEVARASRHAREVPVAMGVHDGTALDVLLAEAGADDLLVLGSAPRAGLADVLLGAVAVQCAEQADGVVVVVRAGQDRLDDPPYDPGADDLRGLRVPVPL